MSKTFTHAGNRWRVVASYPNGTLWSEGSPYLCAVPWDKRRRRWKTERCMMIFPLPLPSEARCETGGLVI